MGDLDKTWKGLLIFGFTRVRRCCSGFGRISVPWPVTSRVLSVGVRLPFLSLSTPLFPSLPPPSLPPCHPHKAVIFAVTIWLICTATQRWFSLHEVLLAGWGMPIGELFDLEKLAEYCKTEGRWSFFVSSEVCNVPGGVASPPNVLAIF